MSPLNFQYNYRENYSEPSKPAQPGSPTDPSAWHCLYTFDLWTRNCSSPLSDCALCNWK
jgi:hypothetical protein